MLQTLNNRSIEAYTRNICRVAHLAVACLLILHSSDILKKGITLFNGTYSLGVACRNTKHAYPVVTRTHSNNSNGHVAGLNALLDKKTIDNLVQRTIATNNNDVSVARVDGRYC